MVSWAGAIACAALAVAISPGSAAAARVRALWPQAGRRRVVRPSVAGGVALVAMSGFLVAGPAGALAAVAVAATVRRRRVVASSERLATEAAGQLAEAIARITEELRAGAHPAAALRGNGADGPHAELVLGPAAAAAALGDDVPAALRRAARAGPGGAAGVERLAAAWALAERHGIPLAGLLGGVAADIRWRVRFGNGVRAQLAGPRATAAVLTVLPALGVGFGQLVGADPIGVLRSGLLGQVLLVVGVALGAAGEAWSGRILRRAVPG